MATCSAFTKSGKPCAYKSRVGHETCGKHAPQITVVQHRCREVKGDGDRCTRMATEGYICAYHLGVRYRAAAQINADDVWADILDRIWAIGGNPPTITELHRMADNGLMDGKYQDIHIALMYVRIDYEMTLFNHENRVEFKGDLHRIALDPQSIHTKAVNSQTNESLDKLLAEEIYAPESDQDVLTEINSLVMGAPAAFSTSDKRKICKDVEKWYNTSECSEKDDHLYRRCLRGLWFLIRVSVHSDELSLRLLQEFKDSVGTCCAGHIGRLCNVLVGFDDAFAPVVSPGELLQQKMAAISAKSCCVEEKVGHAWAVFEELNVPLADRSAWIEAF